MLKLRGDSIPLKLRSIPKPPQELFVLGDNFESIIDRPTIAIVGSRRVSHYGRHVTERLTKALAAEGIVIVSGLALGVDGIVHQAVIDQDGTTIAVLPGGIGRIYPRTHENLGKQIINKGGYLVCEREGNISPRLEDFLIRNRLVTGLADALLITEAAERSGTLNTARHALEQGKVVFAVPGNITSDLSVGTNNLIKAGAIPVTEASDILEAMGWHRKRTEIDNVYSGTDNEMKIIGLLKSGITSGEELLILSKLPRSEYSESLTMLEISGIIRPLGANHWTLK